MTGTKPDHPETPIAPSARPVSLPVALSDLAPGATVVAASGATVVSDVAATVVPDEAAAMVVAFSAPTGVPRHQREGDDHLPEASHGLHDGT
mmetsp:Transcript_35292/g.100532  ORF Transcript_35292/g.100532 Transcript_35292/m.100532 type:complete len:92 (-) Transcript_35292:59-334(-)